MNILAEALQSFISTHATSTLKPHTAGNYQFTFHTFLLATDTDLSTFTTGRAHYSQFEYI